VDAYIGELLCDLDLLPERERDAGRLFAVTKRRVENSNLFTSIAVGEENDTPRQLYPR